jgi:putative redox protein
MTTHQTGHDAASPEGTVSVTEAGTGSYTQQITAGHHRLIADEPQPIGDDTGPTPYDLLLAALGACTSMTVRMYANRKGWPLEQVRVTLRHAHSRARLR